MNTLIEQKMKEFEEEFDYSLLRAYVDCDSMNDFSPLKGKLCYEGMNGAIKAFIRRAMEESYKHGNIDGYAEGWNGYKSRYKKDKNSQPTK